MWLRFANVAAFDAWHGPIMTFYEIPYPGVTAYSIAYGREQDDEVIAPYLPDLPSSFLEGTTALNVSLEDWLGGS